jgi:5-methyltetrahydropteroyltriglutamate--homocysteine methyltransferase
MDSLGESLRGFAAPPMSLQAIERRTAGQTAGQRFNPEDVDQGPALYYSRPVRERIRLARNVPLEEYQFTRSVATHPAKVTFLGPDRAIQRFDLAGSEGIYGDIDEFVADLVAIQRQIVAELVAAGCPYVQIDAPSYTAYVDPPSLQRMRARGDDPARGLARSITADNAIIADFPDTTLGIHLCRGNERGTWHREGSYDAIAEQLFSNLSHHRFLLEYDTERAGGFEPLRFVPKNKVVVLGLVTTKTSYTPTVDELMRRIEEATRYLSLEQLALSPQCGFAGDPVRDMITQDDQWRKLERVLETAARVWGDT